MPDSMGGSWASQQLAEFAAAVAEFTTRVEARQGAVERAAEALDAEVGAIVRDGVVVGSIGFPAGVQPPRELLEAAATLGTRDIELPGFARPLNLLVTHVDASVGVRFLLARDAEERFSPDEHNLVRGMARVYALAMRTLATLEELHERQTLLERLSRIQHSITRGADLQQTLDAIVAGASELMAEPVAAMRLVDRDRPERTHIASAVGLESQVLVEMRDSEIGHGIGGRAIEEDRLIVIEGYGSDAGSLAPMSANPLTAAMSAPVRERGEVVGALTVASYTPARAFTNSEREALLAFAETTSLALTDARLVANALHMAVHDALTGLPNRVLFLDRVDHALETVSRRPRNVAVLFLDLDNFKLVNDSLGHGAGDQLLVAVADRLSGALKAGDTVARFGGDEFAVLADINEEADAIHIAERILAMFAHPFALEGREVFASASIGIAISSRTFDGEALVRDADAAMYRAKSRGRAGYELFDEAMRARVMQRLQLESELHRALKRGELELAYQPIVSLADGAVLGAEALVRWHHPERGLLMPGDFIPIAEEVGLIVPIGEWVLRTACRDAAAWGDLRPDGPPLFVAVNLSARQVSNPCVVHTVRDALERAGLDAPLLELEITESSIIEEADRPQANVLGLRDLGAKLVLDDFGTGYSSLTYLKRFPLDGLKIDRSFTDGLGVDSDDTAIVSAVAGMARGLGLAVTAEGVEHAAQALELRRLGCRRAQGYHYARPMPLADFRAFVARSGRLANAA
jgi:diguanylate cyclase (GGDEF)-like protein